MLPHFLLKMISIDFWNITVLWFSIYFSGCYFSLSFVGFSSFIHQKPPFSFLASNYILDSPVPLKCKLPNISFQLTSFPSAPDYKCAVFPQAFVFAHGLLPGSIPTVCSFGNILTHPLSSQMLISSVRLFSMPLGRSEFSPCSSCASIYTLLKQLPPCLNVWIWPLLEDKEP